MRVLIYGDSITQGFWDLEGGWVARLRKEYDRRSIDGEGDMPTIFNLGISGDSSNEVVARFENETKARMWPGEEFAIVFAVGANDTRIDGTTNFSEPDRYRQNLFKLLGMAKQFSPKIMFVGLTPCVDSRTNPVSWADISHNLARMQEFDYVLTEFCQQNNLPRVEVFKPFQEKQEQIELMPDGLHPNDEGHKLIADLVRPKLDELLS